MNSTVYLADPDCTLHHGDVLDVLRGMPAESVDCVVTSPPGTTCKVARDHGRHSIGIDLNEQYLELAAKRLQQLSLLTEHVPSSTSGTR